MYDPRVGRFLEEDPRGFSAGDTNLFRYVGNDPVNAKDPTGLFEESDNVRNRTIEYVDRAVADFVNGCTIGLFTTVYDRNRLLDGITRLDPTRLPQPPNGARVIGVPSGRNLRGEILGNRCFIGPTGCGPCVGLILVPDNPRNRVFAFHFNSGDNPFATLSRIVTPNHQMPPGYRAILCGSERLASADDDYESRRTLYDAIYWLQTYNVPIRAYVGGPNALVDRDGNIYSNAPRSADFSCYRNQ